MQPQHRSVFIGLRVVPDARLAAAIEAFNARLRQGCRACSLEAAGNLHITLAFLGKAALRDAVAAFDAGIGRLGAADLGVGPLALRFPTVRAFASRKQPARILWAEPAHSDRLSRLAAAFAPALPPDQGEQTLHLTLARVRTPEDGAWVTAHLVDQPLGGEGLVSAVTLLANVGTGAYADLRVAPLTQA